MVHAPLKTLAVYLAGEFENKFQAVAEPAWYVHLRLWQRPVRQLCNDSTYTFFLEQASVVAAAPPYRQRILQISRDPVQADTLQGQYFALSEPLKFQGAGTEPERLKALSLKQLVSLPNSGAEIACRCNPSGAYQFHSALKDGQYCSFEYGGDRKYVYLGFDIGPVAAGDGQTVELLTYDKGIDPGTGRGLWGALMGPFRMVKQADFSSDLG